MSVMVYFKSGVSQVFIVPNNISAVEFRRVAETVGGGFYKVDFMQRQVKPRKLNTSY